MHHAPSGVERRSVVGLGPICSLAASVAMDAAICINHWPFISHPFTTAAASNNKNFLPKNDSHYLPFGHFRYAFNSKSVIGFVAPTIIASNREPFCRLHPMVSRISGSSPSLPSKVLKNPGCPTRTLSRRAVFAQLRDFREALCRASLWLFQVCNQPYQNPVQESDFEWIRTCNPHIHSCQLRTTSSSLGLRGDH